ncbi:MAG: 5-formyltetrahydrofolate cyclo-ligase [Paramuribaculum sp.]|nr:5-formyltetrahydrofolate cyclo-ligase [Paramuribaculum sp.]
MKKDDIRRKVAACKSLLSSEDKERAADALFARIEQMAAFMMADNILVYHSLPDELPTHRFIDRWHGRKNFYLPRVNGVNLDIFPYDRTRLHLGAFRIEEPDGDIPTPLSEIELIIVPGIAFDRNGRRVGRGKGFYDRLLRDSTATKVGIGYDFQFIADDIESESHDVDMDIVVTENRCVVVHNRHR